MISVPTVTRIDEAAYHADPFEQISLSRGIAYKLIDQSPLHGWHAHPRLNPEWEPTEKKAFDIGRAAHRAVLGAGGGYEAIPSDLLASNGAASTKAAKEWIQDARDRGVTPLKEDEVAQIGRMATKVHDRLDQIKVWLDCDRSEMMAAAVVDGALCRVMIDNAPENRRDPLYDFKTTTDASPDAVMRAVMNYGYDFQAAFYLDVWKAATGEDRKFRFIFQEKEAPHEVCVVELDQDSLVMARKKTRRAREIWRNCLGSGSWPGYPTGVQVIGLPSFHHERWLDRESAEGEFRRAHGHDILDQARRWQAPADFNETRKEISA